MVKEQKSCRDDRQSHFLPMRDPQSAQLYREAVRILNTTLTEPVERQEARARQATMRMNIVMPSLHSGLVGQLVLCAFAVALSTTGAGAQAPPLPAPTLEQELATEIDRFVEAYRVAPAARCQVVFVGSSSIRQWEEALAGGMAPS